ncbi:hypothetical protein GCM10008961_03830 [Deinococcus knuensis]|uniref:Uncharacterized protein n=2 Tax=Deinococcus knuensis TaxID=1837380 RepID=A0ABQ2SBJ7_9DEIO|nr:hypothetical protein GCM10008961_03830 [Deinococcus knuensis]
MREGMDEQVRAAHARGLTDAGVAAEVGVSIATVKRVRSRLGLKTKCVTALRGREGEELVAAAAQALGLNVEWRPVEGAPHDLMIEGLRVDAKTTQADVQGRCRFRLGGARQSYYNRYSYAKDYVRDCELLALVCLPSDGGPPSVYFLNSVLARRDVRVRLGMPTPGLLGWTDAFPALRAVRAA